MSTSTSNNLDRLPRYYGESVAEVFSIRINNTDGTTQWSSMVTDAWNEFYIYNRARNDSESILADETLTFEGPYRAIGITHNFILILDLKDKGKDDAEISNGYIARYIADRSNKPLSVVVNGECGKAMVYYAFFGCANEATIQVILGNEDQESSKHVYGSVVARYNNEEFYSTIDENDKKYYQSVLFNKSSSNYVCVRPGDAIPLSKSVVVVPIKSSLIVEVNLWDDRFSSDNKIVKDATEVCQLPNRVNENEVSGKYGKVIVRVSWSILSGGGLS